jgi:hypothetical protein
MSVVPEIVFVPNRGKLGARLFENIGVIDGTNLVYDITIPVTFTLEMPLEIDGVGVTITEVRLDFIRIGLVDWRDLPGRAFTFPVNPVEGYVDGSIYFDSTHQYADLTRLQFGRLTENTLSAEVTITFNFYENSALPNLPETVTVEWAIELDVNSEELDGVLASAKAPKDGR